MNASDAELATLLADFESDQVERKRSAADHSKIRKAICAFANDLPGHGTPGMLFVGAEDDGSCAGLAIDDDLLSLLAQMRADGSIQPIPTTTVQRRVVAGCELAVVLVFPSDQPPVRYNGRAYVKVGPTVQQASPEDERRLAERRRARDTTFDLRAAPGSSLEDLDLDYFRTQYLPRAIAPDVLAANRRSIEQQLEALRLTTQLVPTFGALLVLGRDPQRWVPGAWVQYLRIDGTTLGDPIRDRKELTGRLEDVLRRLDELLELSISVRTDITGTAEIRRPDYPITALRQLARNAVMHRAYDGTNSPARVYWYNDRVEIQNPGGLYGRVTPLNFFGGATDYRNPLVAEAMHHLGFAQRFGYGVALAVRELAANQNAPLEADFQPTGIGVTVRAAP